MDNLLLQDGAAFVVFGTVMTFLVQILKTSFPKLNPRHLAIGLAAIAGITYALVVSFVPQDIIIRAVAISGLAWGFGTSLYKLQK